MYDADYDRSADGEEDVMFSAPNGLKKLRACFRCHLVKTESQFSKDGCDNCAFFKDQDYNLGEYTSANFEGVLSVVDNNRSWVSRYLNLAEFVPGCYALKIRSEMPEQVRQLMSHNNIPFARNPE